MQVIKICIVTAPPNKSGLRTLKSMRGFGAYSLKRYVSHLSYRLKVAKS